MRASFICGGIFDLSKKEKRLESLLAQMEASNFWEDAAGAQKIIDESNQLKSWIIPYNELKIRFENVTTLLPEVSETD